MRIKITLRCNECKQRNYNTMKNKKNTPDKLELNNTAPSARSTPSTPKPSNQERLFKTWQKKRRKRTG